MESELSYNTQIFDKDPKYTDCEHCDSVGYNYVKDSDNPEDAQLIKEICEHCNGEGVILIEN